MKKNRSSPRTALIAITIVAVAVGGFFFIIKPQLQGVCSYKILPLSKVEIWTPTDPEPSPDLTYSEAGVRSLKELGAVGLVKVSFIKRPLAATIPGLIGIDTSGNNMDDVGDLVVPECPDECRCAPLWSFNYAQNFLATSTDITK
ncbi:MAG: hypothetical protein ACKVU0_08355 [Saprospiraceae bacterium]